MRIHFDVTGKSMLEEQLLHKRIECAQLRQQLEMFSTFLPNYILDELETEGIPFVGVVLNVHISGMHKLIEKFNKYNDGGIYNLTSTLNAFLGSIIEAITYWGGDVIKIYGDSCLNLWKVSADESLYDILHLVVVCAGIMKDSLRNFDTGISHKLKLKLTVACGNLHLSSYGQDVKIMMIRGEAMEELSKLIEIAKPGDIYISSRAWAHMIQERYDAIRVDTKSIKIISGKISYQANERELHLYFSDKEIEVRDLIKKHIEYMHILHASRQIDTKEVLSKLEKQFIAKIPVRSAVKMAPRKCVLDNIRSFVCQRVQMHVDGNEPVEYLTEITTLTVQVICIKPNSPECITHAFLHHIFYELDQVILNIHAFIYKFEVQSDIKIVVLNGLHSSRQDMECQLALRSGFLLSQHFEKFPGIESTSVGVFKGYLYCGVLGHPYRRDYTILGSAMNRAFNAIERYQGKVICDFKTYKFSKLSSFYFRCIGTRKCRVLMETGQLLEYNEIIDESDESGTLEMEQEEVTIFGRQKEIDIIIATLESAESISLGVVIAGEEKMGKTAVLHFALNRITNSSHFVLASLTLEEASTTPYFVISKIYRQLHDLNARLYGNVSKLSSLPADLMDIHEEYNEDYDIAITKYRILNSFRDMIGYGSKRTCVIVIDNVQYIDMSSWEVLDIVLSTCKVRFLAAGNFDKLHTDVAVSLASNENVTFYTMKPLSNHWINTVACHFLCVAALSAGLSNLLVNTCLGRPGYVQNCLSYFINSENMMIKYEFKENITAFEYVKIDDNIYSQLPEKISVMSTFDHTNRNRTENISVTIASITNEFYNSLDPFEQTILKTSSVLGTIFTRNLLIVALHYPDRNLLLQAFKNLFEKGIFGCGSSFVNGFPIEPNRICCRCYMTDTERQDMDEDTYKYCKVIHFCNNNIKLVANSLIPINQKKDLHLMCTDVLENTLHLCPQCLRNPINSFMVNTKFKEILDYCNNDAAFKQTACDKGNPDTLKDCIRRTVRGLYDRKRNLKEKPLRDSFDQNQCYCFDILLFVYKQLIHHSANAKHLAKTIFFFTSYGLLLILVKNIVPAISILREARELCFTDLNLAGCEISEPFRKYHVGRISCALASAFIILRQMTQAKCQMSIALRQYNIPSLVMNFSHFRLFLKKNYLVNVNRNYHPMKMKSTWMHWEIGMCMIICAKIFAIEGNWQYAKSCSAYSIWTLSQMNERIPMLFDVYCSAIDLYRYGMDKEVCEKLQKYVTKEVLLNYCNNRGLYARHLIYLVNIEFELRVTSGKVNKAIRMLYRIIDVTMKIFIFITKFEVINWVAVLFIYAMRLQDFNDLMNVIRGNVRDDDDKLWYYANALSICVYTAYSFTSIDGLIKDVYTYLTYNPQVHVNWEKNYLLSLLHLHLLKSDMLIVAEKYKPNCPFNSATLKKPIAMRVLLNLIESSLLEIVHRKTRQHSFRRLETTLNRQLKLAKSYIMHVKILLPRFYCLSAWRYRLLGSRRKSKQNLHKAYRISTAQGNQYYVCFIRQLRNHWKGRAPQFYYKTRVRIDIKEAYDFNLNQWSQVLLPYPIL